MATAKALASAGLKLCEPLICVGLKAVLQVPEGVIDAGVKWVRERFTDHSLALTKAVATAHDRAWQAVALALATDNLFSHVANLFRDGDLKAVQKQIREFVATADTGLDDAAAGLRTKACNELLQLKKAGRFTLDGAELTSLDLTRFASSAKVTDDAHSAILLIVAGLQADAPHLAQVLTLTPPAGGAPLLAVAFAYFLRREIATNAELARDLHFDQLRLLTLKQQAGFGNIEAVIETKSGELLETIGGWFAVQGAELDDIKRKLEQLLDQNQVSKKPESPLRVSVTSEAELARLKQLRDRLREQPAELVDAEVRSMLGDGLAAANQCADALTEHAAAAAAAHDAADSTAEADAVYKQYKDACELKQWDTALSALKQAVALDERRFRPVPKHYAVDAVLGAGSFGVVLKCRDTAERGDDGQHLVVAVKTFRAADLDRPFDEVFAEASVLKTLNHENVIRIHERGFADGDAQQRPFLAMEFVPGVTLEEHLAQHGRLSEDDFTSIFRQIAAGLHAAHTARRRVIHRDLKPANVMVWKDGTTWRVKVIDFGLAVRGAIRSSSVSVPHSFRATRDKAVTGTIKYAAPEQLGEKPYPVGLHSDVFAFGKTALEAALGTVQPSLEDWDELPKELATLLNRCVSETYLADDPSKRRFHGFAPVLDVLRVIERESDPAAKRAEEARREAERLAKEEQERREKEAEQNAREERERQEKEDNERRKERAERERLAAELEEAKRKQAELLREQEAARAAADRMAEELRKREAEESEAPSKTGTDGSIELLPLATKRPKSKEIKIALLKYYDSLPNKNITDTALADMFGKDRTTVARWLCAHDPARRTQSVRFNHEGKEFEVGGGDSNRPDTWVKNVVRIVPKAGDPFTLDLPVGLKMSFAWCPPGAFLMGSPASEMERQDQEQQHEVRLTKGFYAGVHPVTRGEFAQFVADSNYKTEAETRGGSNWRNPGFTQTDEHPVTVVSWNDAVAFCKWLEGQSKQKIRLPTEAEWEYLCRGGTTTPFYWGTELNGMQANCFGNCPYGTDTKGPFHGKTTPVYSYAKISPHPWSLTDVHGNVWEWCADWYDAGFYARSPKEDPECRDGEQEYRVLRGGSWTNVARDCRAADRVRNVPASRVNYYGFRVVFNPD